jgi:hypothetical protein
MKSLYKPRSTLDPHTITSEDIFVKLASARAKLAGDVVRLSGCPVSVAEQVLALLAAAPKLKNPYLDPSQALTFTRGYLGWKARVTLNRLQRRRYQQNGTFRERGQAAPELQS